MAVRLREMFGPGQLPGRRWFQRVAQLLNNPLSFNPRLLVRVGTNGMEYHLDDGPTADQAEHPWRITVTKTGSTLKYAVAAGRVWTRESDIIDVTAVPATTFTATITLGCKVTVPDAGGTITAVIEAATGTVDYWVHASGGSVVKWFPLGKITVTAGVPHISQWRYQDIDAGAGCNINDDATSLLSDGTTEFLVLTQQGAAGATAAAKVRKLTIQVDHGRVIRWTWGTPATAIGFTASTARHLTGNYRFGTGGDVGKLQYEYVLAHYENGVLLYVETAAWADTGITVDLTSELDLVTQVRINSSTHDVEGSSLKVKLAISGSEIALAAGSRGAWAGVGACDG